MQMSNYEDGVRKGIAFMYSFPTFVKKPMRLQVQDMHYLI